MFIVYVCFFSQKCNYVTGHRKRKKLLYVGVNDMAFKRQINAFVPDEMHSFTLEHEFRVSVIGKRDQRRSIERVIERSSCTSLPNTLEKSDGDVEKNLPGTADKADRFSANSFASIATNTSIDTNFGEFRTDNDGGEYHHDDDDDSMPISWIDLISFFRQFVCFPLKHYTSPRTSVDDFAPVDDILLLNRNYEFVRVIMLDDEEYNIILSVLYKLQHQGRNPGRKKNRLSRCTNSVGDFDNNDRDTMISNSTKDQAESSGGATITDRWLLHDNEHDHDDSNAPTVVGIVRKKIDDRLSQNSVDRRSDIRVVSNEETPLDNLTIAAANDSEATTSIYYKCQAKIDELMAMKLQRNAP